MACRGRFIAPLRSLAYVVCGGTSPLSTQISFLVLVLALALAVVLVMVLALALAVDRYHQAQLSLYKDALLLWHSSAVFHSRFPVLTLQHLLL